MAKLDYADLGFTMVPQERLLWPRENRGGILRGAIGSILREVVCDTICPSTSECRYAPTCAYQLLFAPKTPSESGRLSLNSDRPRPFIIQPGLEAKEFVDAGDSFSFTVRLFGWAVELYPYVIMVFSQLIRSGFGPRRIPCGLSEITFDGKPFKRDKTYSPESSLDLTLPAMDRGIRLEVGFVTPVALKHDNREVYSGENAFEALAKRARDRISSLYHFYGAEIGKEASDLDWDFKGLGEMAKRPRCLEDKTRWLVNRRRSGRTGQTHFLSGLIGRAVYYPVPAPLRALLKLASLTHVGGHATFGLGRIVVR